MRRIILILLAFLVGACVSTGGKLVGPSDSLSPANAVIIFSVEIADDTKFQQCSVFAGRSIATAAWFGWNVAEKRSTLFALEVPAGKYRFYRLGCVYNRLPLNTSDGPELTLRAGEVTYLGRLVVDSTEFGSAPGYRRMPTAVRLSVEDRRELDLADLQTQLPLFSERNIDAAILPSWGEPGMKTLRPYRLGGRVVVAPTAGSFLQK